MSGIAEAERREVAARFDADGKDQAGSGDREKAVERGVLWRRV
jgi:hypothetical protein